LVLQILDRKPATKQQDGLLPILLAAKCSVTQTVVLDNLIASGTMLAIDMPAALGCARNIRKKTIAKSTPISLREQK